MEGCHITLIRHQTYGTACCRMYQWKKIPERDVHGNTNNRNDQATIILCHRGEIKRRNKIDHKRNG